MKRLSNKNRNNRKAFTLAEILAALIIGSMILIAVLGIYSRAERSSAAVMRKLDDSWLPSEVLQRIAEDLDQIVSSDKNTRITITNKLDNGFSTARIQILKTIYNKADKSQDFEKIIWQTSFGYTTDSGALVLYRSHTGIASEDKLLDKQRADWEQTYSFVPICTGVTYFKIQIPTDQSENMQERWTSNSLPPGIVVTISFAQPFKRVDGTFDVPDTEKIARTIAVDRTRKIAFEFVKKESEDEETEKTQEDIQNPQDANELRKPRTR